MIGENIEISILDVQGDNVRIGIKAPRDISIHRKEVFLEIQAENKKAASTKATSFKGLQIGNKKK